MLAQPALRELPDALVGDESFEGCVIGLGGGAAEGEGDFAERQLEEALAQFDQILANWPDHSRAEDALFMEAMIQDALGDQEAAVALLKKYLEKYPDGRHAESVRPYLKYVKSDA